MIYEGHKSQEIRADFGRALTVRLWLLGGAAVFFCALRLCFGHQAGSGLFTLLAGWLAAVAALRGAAARVPAGAIPNLHTGLFVAEAGALGALIWLTGSRDWVGFLGLVPAAVLALVYLDRRRAFVSVAAGLAAFGLELALEASGTLGHHPFAPAMSAGGWVGTALPLFAAVAASLAALGAAGGRVGGLKAHSGELKLANERLRTLHGEISARNTALVEHQQKLVEANDRLLRQNEELSRSHEVILSLATAVESKDNYTAGHSLRVASYASILAKALGLPLEARRAIKNGSILHDVGKITVSDLILRKDGPLTDAEFALMRSHPVEGEKIIRPLHFCRPYLDIVRHHHERVDGKGYPDGLTGRQISLEAKIVAIADAFDAMTSDRAYRRRLPVDVAFARLREYSDLQWDGDLVAVFIQAMEPHVIRGELVHPLAQGQHLRQAFHLEQAPEPGDPAPKLEEDPR